jgi:pimeloyl-ACP methyl ester carboxylesterase
MPNLALRGARLFYTEAGPKEGQPVLLGHGYLMTHKMWDYLVEDLVAAGFRAIRFDWRGQGESEITDKGYDPWDLARDVLAIADELGLDRFHYVGHAMGGYVGMRLGILEPDRLGTLTLIGTTAQAEDNAGQYKLLMGALKLFGYGPLVGRLLPTFFSKEFASKAEFSAQRDRMSEVIKSNPKAGALAAGKGIFERDDLRGQLHEIGPPCLFITGSRDKPHPPEHVYEAAERIVRAETEILQGIGHTPPVEAPDVTNPLIVRHLQRWPLSRPRRLGPLD